jgi:acyl carrier protein
MEVQVSSMSNLQRLQNIFREELDSPHLEISMDSIQEEIEGWDSLATIRIVAAVEREFECQFDAAQIEGISSVADIVAIIPVAK